MLYTAEDAIQIYHAKSSTLEFFAAKVPKAAWQGIRKEDIEPAQEYYSDDIIVDFDLLDRDAYEEKVCGGANSAYKGRFFIYFYCFRGVKGFKMRHSDL